MSHAQSVKELPEGERCRQPSLFESNDYAHLIERNRRAGSSKPKRSGVDALETVAEKLVTVAVREAFGIILEECGWDRLFGSKHPGSQPHRQGTDVRPDRRAAFEADRGS